MPGGAAPCVCQRNRRDDKPEVGCALPNQLKDGLELGGADRGDDDATARCCLTEDRHCQLTTEYDDNDPPWQAHVAPGRHEGQCPGRQIARRERRALESPACALHECPHRDECPDQQQLVGERIEELAECRLLLSRTGEHAVGIVRNRREEEQDEGEETRRCRGRERKGRDQRCDRDATYSQRIREIHSTQLPAFRSKLCDLGVLRGPRIKAPDLSQF